MTCAIYPGTFDPMTLGHLDVLRRASGIFDKVIVAVAESSAKKPLFSLSERIAFVNDLIVDMPNVEVEGFTGLLVDFLRNHGARVIVRGVRDAGDFSDECQMAGANRLLMPEVETVFLASSPKYQSVKGSLVREIVKMGGDVSAFLAPTTTKTIQGILFGLKI